MKFQGTSMVLITWLMTAIAVHTAVSKLTVKTGGPTYHVRRCANITLTQGFKTFAIHQYGECYAFPDGPASNTYAKDGTSIQCINSNNKRFKCRREFSEDDDDDDGDDDGDDDDDDSDDDDDDDDDERSRSRTELCAGKRDTNYVYIIASSELGPNQRTIRHTSTTQSSRRPRTIRSAHTHLPMTSVTSSTQSSPSPRAIRSAHTHLPMTSDTSSTQSSPSPKTIRSAHTRLPMTSDTSSTQSSPSPRTIRSAHTRLPMASDTSSIQSLPSPSSTRSTHTRLPMTSDTSSIQSSPSPRTTRSAHTRLPMASDTSSIQSSPSPITTRRAHTHLPMASDTSSIQSSPSPITTRSAHTHLPMASDTSSIQSSPSPRTTRSSHTPQTSSKPTAKQPACTRPLDVVVAVDSSKSPPPKLFNNMRNFLVQMLPEFAISKNGSHFVVFGFDRIHYNRLTFAQPSTFHPSFIGSRINELKSTSEPTVLTTGIREAQAVLLSSGVRDPGSVSRVVVLVTNGTTVLKEAQLLVNITKEFKEKTKARLVVLTSGTVKLKDKELVQVLAGNYFHINKDFTQVDLISAANVICDKEHQQHSINVE